MKKAFNPLCSHERTKSRAKAPFGGGEDPISRGLQPSCTSTRFVIPVCHLLIGRSWTRPRRSATFSAWCVARNETKPNPHNPIDAKAPKSMPSGTRHFSSAVGSPSNSPHYHSTSPTSKSPTSTTQPEVTVMTTACL